MKDILRLAVSVAAFAAVSHASAGTLSYSGYGLLNPQNVTITDTALGVSGDYGAAGQITLTNVALGGNPSADFLAWCIDIQHFFQGSGTFIFGSPPSGSGVSDAAAGEIAALIANSGGALATDGYNASAAVQMAIWKVEYGNALVLTPDNSALTALSNSYVANVTGGTWTPGGMHLDVLSNGGTNNQELAYDAPAPSAIGPFGVGLAALGVFRFRRRRT